MNNDYVIALVIRFDRGCLRCGIAVFFFASGSAAAKSVKKISFTYINRSGLGAKAMFVTFTRHKAYG